MGVGLYFYKLVSPYENDVTKNCKLTINEIDSNFLTLKDADIKEAYLDKGNETLVLVRNNGDKIYADLSDLTYNLDVDKTDTEDGVTLTITYATGGETKQVSLENVVTLDNLGELLDKVGYKSVLTDETLIGDGTVHHPLGIRGTERTGMYAPAQCLIDCTKGYKLPANPSYRDRYVTREYIHDYGYLYNGAGLCKIMKTLDEERKGWRIPTKADWDALLNYLEPCNYKNHGLSKCHVELGLNAGKFLKSACGWEGQEPCTCGSDKPYYVNCECAENVPLIDGSCGSGETFDADDCTTSNPEHPDEGCPTGVDKYGMTILPAGRAHLDGYGRPEAELYGTDSIFWSSSHVNNDPDQDRYVKHFVYNRGGVIQEAECPSDFFSVRLVKDYDGTNYFDAEVIDGIVYKTVLFSEINQIWLTTNYAQTQGFNEEGVIEYVPVNNGQGIQNERVVLFINEYNGTFWEKKHLLDGDTLVINHPIAHHDQPSSQTICWIDVEGVERCVEVDVSSKDLENSEYRVYIGDDCNAYLENTNELVFIATVMAVAKLIDIERREREAADEELHNEIVAETERATSAETALDEKIEAEKERAISAETELHEEIEAEKERAISAETELHEEIVAEMERAMSAETELHEEIEAETERAISAETELHEEIVAETERAISAETALDEKIDEEVARVEGMTLDPEAEYLIEVTSGLTLTMKNGDTIHVDFDGDWGTF